MKVKFLSNTSYQTFPIVGDDYIEITEDQLDAIGKTLQFKNGELVPYSPPIDYTIEINKLKYWFETYYTQHEQKYVRLIAMGKTTDTGEDPNEKLKQLYVDAENKRSQIQDLESLVEKGE